MIPLNRIKGDGLFALLVAATGLLAASLWYPLRSSADTPVPANTYVTWEESCLRFHGAWFDICYPADFTIVPSLPSRTAEGFDSAYFESPDGTVSFYVFAPQWGGEATDIAVDPERERLIAEQRKPLPNGEIRWFTIAAKDGSYYRAYRDTIEQQGSVRTILGIKYSSEEARRRYAGTYAHFRRSLNRYGD